ncbi:hypothetical protein NUACC21_24610 [Scytonema sp. NUACC21]
MAQNVNKTGLLHKVGRILQEFVEFIFSPWFHRASVKSLQRRVDYLERRVYESLPNTEQRLDSLIQHCQQQFAFLQNSTKNQLDKFVEYDLRQQVLEVLKDQTHIILQSIKPTVEELISELEQKKYLEENGIGTDIQAKQHKLQESLAQIQQLSTLLPTLEEHTAACLEAGHWLLVHKEELAQEVASELLGSQHPQIEVFRCQLSRYLKLLGSCLENGIEPHLLYQGIITHQQPSIETYLQAFKLIEDRYIPNWEHSSQISTKAAGELRKYFHYVTNYVMTALL